MRIPDCVSRGVLLVFCFVVGMMACDGLHGVVRAETEQGEPAAGMEPVTGGCVRGYAIGPGETCRWTIEGDEVEIHVDADRCALVTSKNYRMRYAHPGPRLCPGREALSEPGLAAVQVEDTIVTLTSEAPVCGMLSISRPSLAFDGTDIRVWPGLDLEGVIVRWTGAHWTVQETPSQAWMTAPRQGDVRACRSGQLLAANDVCRHGDYVAVVGQQTVRIDVWEDGMVGPEKWVVDPDGTCYAMASMSARAFAAVAIGGLQFIWEQITGAWSVVELRPSR